MKLLLQLIGLSLLLNSCDSNRIYEQNYDLADALWKLEDIQKFNFEIDEINSDYNLSLNLRNSLSYPFHNIYIKYYLKDSLNTILSSELKEYYLFDPKSGQPQGDGLGDLFDNRFTMIEDYNFPYVGEYTMEIEQFMRLDSLPLIVSVGLRVARNSDQ